MSELDVPGARLYYETHGSGPLLVLIPGASGTADGFRMVTQHLAAHYTVAIYDRRGFSRSRLDGPQDYDRRLATDADDVRRLIEHLSGEPATIFGASSGAIVALEVLTRHPSVVRTLVPFEPPAVRQLPDGQDWLDFFSGMYDRYRTSGIEPALESFRERAFAPVDRAAMARAPRSEPNATYWFEHELRQYPRVDLDLDALATHADRIVPAVGRESRGYPCYEVTMVLGNKLGRDVAVLPGGHIGCMTRPAEFAAELVGALSPARVAPSRICGRHIHRAAHALTTLRTAALDRAGISFTQWKVLDKAPGTNPDTVAHTLAGLAVGEEAAIRAAVDELRDRGLIGTDQRGNLTRTAEGDALFHRVDATRTELHDRLYDGIPPGDLATTARVLDQIAERAGTVHVGR